MCCQSVFKSKLLKTFNGEKHSIQPDIEKRSSLYQRFYAAELKDALNK